ncbi:MAG TPA: hypothetical protein DCX07_04250, partial [Phycisphaerales bacterium]|nr:hypothetical protein [Phycisphaerales bacterium]
NDPTKAFGDFRFELHEFVPNATDPKGRRLSTWDVSVVDPKTNLLHWDGITRTYQFKLKWVNPVPVGERFVLRAVFSSPHTDRLFDERVLVSGQ